MTCRSEIARPEVTAPAGLDGYAHGHGSKGGTAAPFKEGVAVQLEVLQDTGFRITVTDLENVLGKINANGDRFFSFDETSKESLIFAAEFCHMAPPRGIKVKHTSAEEDVIRARYDSAPGADDGSHRLHSIPPRFAVCTRPCLQPSPSVPLPFLRRCVPHITFACTAEQILLSSSSSCVSI